VRFEPANDPYGAVSYTVTVHDGAASSAARVQVNIAPVNDAPFAEVLAFTTDEDTPGRGTLTAKDVDLDSLSFAVSLQASHGVATVLDAARGTYSYVPVANWFGDDTFFFTVTDPSGATGVGQVKVRVAAVNDAPVAEGDHLTAPCTGRTSGRLKGFDRESPRVTFRLASEPRQGRVTIVDARTGDFVFDSDGLDGEPVTFSFVAFDGELASEPAEMVVHPKGACGRGDLASR
jgi:large repetitive protein